ncbi:hypothetical protein DAEQUDRAFT_374672 [Daedalea quercina L-15889]|uniref:Uncharacterized protein n=1 Tax=Daedalea quercina L-15889 TaxID=1314783 RepID=A0A165P782_9APHY|nr:hypothetical protein DAEQUDRAFT_374672 [Daedalea quercina L-15889]
MKLQSEVSTGFRSKVRLTTFLKLQGIIKYEDLRKPQMLDQDRIVVLKGGNTIGVTIDRATVTMSFVGEHLDGGEICMSIK